MKGMEDMKELNKINTETDTGTEEHSGIEKQKRKYVKNESANSDSSGTFRVVIAKEANEALEELVTKVGVGFDAGTITKSDVANFVFQNLAKYLTGTDTKALRSLHFDDKKVLSNILRHEDELPEELKKAIRLHFGVNEKEKKKSTANALDLSTDPSVDKS